MNFRARLARLERLIAGRPRCRDGCLPSAIIEPGRAPPADIPPCPRCGNPGVVLVLTEEIITSRADAA